MAVLKMIAKLTDALDTRLCAMGIFIDLTKAFDTVECRSKNTTAKVITLWDSGSVSRFA